MYEIIAIYMGKSKEVIDETETYGEACFLCQEYRLAYGPDFTIELQPKEKKSC